MKKCSIFLIVLLTLMLCLGATTVLAEQNVRVFLDGNEISYDVPPQIIEGRTMVPLRTTVELITGYAMQWDEATRTVTFIAGGHTNRHTIGENVVYVDNQPRYFDSPSTIISYRTLVPIRMIAETSGYVVNWDQNNFHVYITPPADQRPPVAASPMIIQVDYSSKSVTEGQSITVTVTTNTAVNNVWVDMGNRNHVQAELTYSGSEEKMWRAIIYPERSMSITVLANTSYVVQGAATKAQQITVTDNPVKINKHTVDRTSIYAGESVTFTIETTYDVNYVWVEFGNEREYARYTGESRQHYKTWEVTIYPNETERIRIYANESRTITGAASKTQQITVSQGRIEIIRLYASRTTIDLGEYTTLTIETGRGVEYVYVEYDNTSKKAVFVETNRDRDIWTVDISPRESQRVYVTAYSHNDKYGSDSQNININVNAAPAERPEIYAVSTDRDDVNLGGYVTVTVTTNNYALYVWAITYDNQRFNAIEVPSGLIGSKFWTVNVYPTESGYVNIYANVNSSQSGAVSDRIYLNVFIGVEPI